MASGIDTCKFYNTDTGCRRPNCTYLHVCRYFLLDTCKYGPNCKRSHDFDSPDVRQILDRHGIRKKGKNLKKHLKQLLSDHQGAASTCCCHNVPGYDQGRASSLMDLRAPAQGLVGYNVVNDNSSSCEEDTVASASRKGRRRRPRRRKFGEQRAQSMVMLNSYQGGSDESSDEDAEGSSLICTFQLKGNCEFGEQCRNQHKVLPYQWQCRREGTNDRWRDTNKAGNEKLENSYCNVNEEKCLYKYGSRKSKETEVNFDKIEGDIFDSSFELQFRRLTTPSHKDTTSVFATEWKWYWETDEKSWKEYGMKNKVISSDDLEGKFLENRDGRIRFKTVKGGFEYEIDFNKMYQKNMGTKSKRSIRRRPAKHNPADLTGQRLSNAVGAPTYSQSASSKLATQIPSCWTVRIGTDIGDHFSRIVIYNGSKKLTKECEDVFASFNKTMPRSARISSIERIQNMEIWTSFVLKRERMERKTRNPNEKILFHGTSAEYSEAISKQGFDFRFNGKSTGTKYGKGSYFARDCSLADNFTSRERHRTMFQVRVLVGDFTLGNKQHVRPPPKSPKNPLDLYDSCVNNIFDPEIFVIFTFDQAYPEYIIKYTA